MLLLWVWRVSIRRRITKERRPRWMELRVLLLLCMQVLLVLLLEKERRLCEVHGIRIQHGLSGPHPCADATGTARARPCMQGRRFWGAAS